MLYAAGIGALLGSIGLHTVLRWDATNALVVALATAIGCGALALPLLRPELQRPGRALQDALAAALVGSATLALAGPILAVLASPTVADALTPRHLPMTIGSVLGAAVALPILVRTWRELGAHEWRHLALGALLLGVLLAPGGDMWFPLLGVAGLQIASFVVLRFQPRDRPGSDAKLRTHNV